jgi:arylsulfatase A-like enzyme
MRVPAVACWPGKIPAGRTTTELGSAMDLFSTCLDFAGVEPPKDRVIDGVSLAPVLTGKGSHARKSLFYYRGGKLMAVRKGPWKAHLSTMPGYGTPSDWKDHQPPLLFQLDQDPSERFDVAGSNPAVIADLLAEVDAHRKTVQAVVSQVDDPPTRKP